MEDDGAVTEVIEEAGAEEVEVMEVECEDGGGDVEVALKMELASGERGIEATGREGVESG